MNARTIDSMILVAPGFQERPVIERLIGWRDAGQSVWLIGTVGVIRGQHGLTIRVDRTLGQVPENTLVKRLILPGGQRCARTLLSDPRVHRLIEATRKTGGEVMTDVAAEMELRQMGLWEESFRALCPVEPGPTPQRRASREERSLATMTALM